MNLNNKKKLFQIISLHSLSPSSSLSPSLCPAVFRPTAQPPAHQTSTPVKPRQPSTGSKPRSQNPFQNPFHTSLPFSCSLSLPTIQIWARTSPAKDDGEGRPRSQPTNLAHHRPEASRRTSPANDYPEANPRPQRAGLWFRLLKYPFWWFSILERAVPSWEFIGVFFFCYEFKGLRWKWVCLMGSPSLSSLFFFLFHGF